MLSRSRTHLALAAACLAAALSARADIVPGTVSTDPFDSTQGVVIGANDAIVDPINAFRTSGGFEDGHVLMRNATSGSMSFIEFDTACPTAIDGLRLFAHNDGAGFGFRRAMAGFSLLADTDGNLVFETTVVTTTINVDYATQPGNAATDSTNLDLTFVLPVPVTSQRWRIEVIQGTDQQPFEGARVVEVDALGAPCASPTPQEVSPLGDLRVARDTGTALRVTYTPACGATDNAAFIGWSIAALSALDWTLAACRLGNSGVATFDIGDPGGGAFFYFVLAGNDGVEEGSYGRDSFGVERPPALGLACQHAQDLLGTCP